jgi:hypothetical protein
MGGRVQAEQGPDAVRGNQTPLHGQQSKPFVLLYCGLAVIPVLLAVIHAIKQPAGGSQHFIYLADGWLHGHLYLHDVPVNTQDYTLHDGHWYVALPPLPAVLLLPLVAIFHLSDQDAVSLIFSVAMGLLNSWLMLGVLKRFPHSLSTGLSGEGVMWYTALFALGTEHLYAMLQGNVWFIAHIVTTTFLLLYTGETFGKRRPFVAGLYLGLASLSRITALFTFPLFVLLTISSHFADRKVRGDQLLPWQALLHFFAVLGIFVAAMLMYNLARFGSLFDFGYSTMNVNSLLRSNLYTYGQFSPHFIPTNLRYMLLDPPRLLSQMPYLSFSPLGTGIFWTMPALVFAFLAFRYKEDRAPAALLASCLLPAIFLLLYFNTGWYQFGYRFVLDFLPFALLLAILGMRAVPGKSEKVLIVLSIAMNIWGCLVFIFFAPPASGW